MDKELTPEIDFSDMPDLFSDEEAQIITLTKEYCEMIEQYYQKARHNKKNWQKIEQIQAKIIDLMNTDISFVAPLDTPLIEIIRVKK